MYFIGIVSKNIELINYLIQKECKIVIITKDNINKYSKQKIDILIVENKLIKNKDLELLCNNSKYILVHDSVNLNIKLKNKSNIITFGFNHKSTVTVSSISNEELSICIQRAIKTVNQYLIAPQEIIIKLDQENDINEKIIEKIMQEILEK